MLHADNRDAIFGVELDASAGSGVASRKYDRAKIGANGSDRHAAVSGRLFSHASCEWSLEPTVTTTARAERAGREDDLSAALTQQSTERLQLAASSTTAFAHAPYR